MHKSSFKGTSRFQKFLNGNGFYVAIAACLLAIGGVAVALVGQTLFHDTSEGVSQPPISTAEPVEQIVTNQPDDRTTTTATTTATTTTTAAQPDLYVLPCGNLVQKSFSGGAPVYSATMKDWRVHNGTDYSGEDGQTVRALARGTVSAIEEDPLWGEVLVIDHGVEVLSRYCGVHATVKVGDTLDAGDAIGKLTSIPCEAAQAPHLHVEITVKGELVDPVSVLGLDVRYEEGAAPTTGAAKSTQSAQ
ncbi:MAG: M23 family metallopeptidase [Clostridia bacterium]|nr:M23 family metallopeptidase [Clostridia bacterium]